MLPFRLPAFLRFLPLLTISLSAQELDADAQLLLDTPVPPPVDMIQLVPEAELPDPGLSLGAAMPDNITIDNQGGTIEGNVEKTIRLGGPVHVKGDSGVEIFSRRAEVDLQAKKITFIEDVTVFQGNMLQRGDRAVYFYETRVLDATGLRASMDPIVMEAGKFSSEWDGEKQIFIGKDAGITTQDVEKPQFWVRSDTTTIYPGDRVTFRNLKLYAGDTPIFWLPYLSQPLDSVLGYHFSPGARSNWGPYLLNTYGIMLGGERNPETGENEEAWLLSQWRLDFRATRGIAAGVDLKDIREEYVDEISGLSLYHLYDLNPQETRTGIPRAEIDPNRYKIQLKHRYRFEFEQDAEWRLDTNLTKLSDQHYLEDFEIDTYRVNPAPDNTIGLFRRDDDSLLSIFGRFRLNDFYRTDTHLPEIAYDQVLKPVFGSQFLHEGQTSFSIRAVQAGDVTRREIINPLLTLPPGNSRVPELLLRLNGYERRLVQQIRALPPGDPRADALRSVLLDTGFHRFHTNHSFSLPIHYGDWFTVTPRIGAAFTNYSSVQGPADSDARLLLHGGAEASLKITKDYGNVSNHSLGLDGMLHFIRPYANLSIVSADELGRDFPRIDRRTFTTRPRTLDPSRYTAIDEFEDWNILRLGTRNHLITRRDQQSHEWLFLDTYIDRYFQDPEGSRNWSNLYNDLRWQPLPWLGLDIETQFPLSGGNDGFSEFASRLRYMPNANVELSLAYRHLSNNPALLDSDRIELTTYIRLSENWGAGSHHVFEMDSGILENQQYTLHRDFGTWVVGGGFTHRSNLFEDEFGVVLALTLKDFPSISLPFGTGSQ